MNISLSLTTTSRLCLSRSQHPCNHLLHSIVCRHLPTITKPHLVLKLKTSQTRHPLFPPTIASITFSSISSATQHQHHSLKSPIITLLRITASSSFSLTHFIIILLLSSLISIFIISLPLSLSHFSTIISSLSSHSPLQFHHFHLSGKAGSSHFCLFSSFRRLHQLFLLFIIILFPF